MKNLATCTPTEFIKQTARIRDSVADWLEKIELVEIRNKQPDYLKVPIGATAEERAEIIKKNAVLLKKQSIENFGRIFDNAFSKYPEETLNVLALSCFVEPSDVDNHTMDEYLANILDMLENETVLRFFMFLASTKAHLNVTSEA